MVFIKRMLNSFVFWGAWIVIPFIMEIIPAFGSFTLLLKRRHRVKKKETVKIEFYPEISIIIPVYNSQNTLFSCVESVYTGSYPVDRIRVFLVNNQGQDDSFQVFAKCQEAFPDLQMQWLNAEQGKSRALNLALYNSEGKYIINVDSDGTLEKNALLRMITKFENNPDLNCMTGAVLTSPDLIEKYKRKRSRLLRKLEFMEYAQAFLAGRSYASETNSVYTLSGAFSAFRKSAILNSRLYNTDTICEDTQVTFQMRYIYHEKVEICEDAIFFVEPIDDLNKLYTQRQRWQRGSLEVAKMFYNKNFRLKNTIKDVNVRTMLYDHTFAFPRMIWYMALLCLLSIGYSSKVIFLSTAMLFIMYIVIGYLYFITTMCFLKKMPEIQKYYRKHWWCVLLLPLFNLMVFFIRMAGIVNSINTDSAWRTRNLTEEKQAFLQVIRKDTAFVTKGMKKVEQLFHKKESSKWVKDKKAFGWYVGIGLIYTVSLILTVAGTWVKNSMGVGLSEMLATLKGPLNGTGTDMLGEVMIHCVLPVLAFLLFWVIFSIISSRFDNKTIIKVQKLLEKAAVLFLVISVFLSNFQFQVLSYVKAKGTETTVYEDYYVSPDSVAITAPGQAKNLIYIYLESMETTYASQNAGGFQKTDNYMPRLTQLAEDNLSFGEGKGIRGWHAIYGTTWTMAALLATTSGVPYCFTESDAQMQESGNYASGLISLGDILEQNGYQSEFMCGSDATFGGRAAYFKTHGKYQIFDYYTAKERGLFAADYYEHWGFEDRKLFTYAKDEILALADSGKPFNFTMLTVDTHATGGYVCEECEDIYEVATANVVDCTDRHVAAFIDWCKQQDFYEDTVIIISGDHPRMDSFLVDGVSYYDREVYNCFINAAAEPVLATDNRILTAMDMYPSILVAMGFQIEGDRLGLGTNLFSGKQTLAEEKGYNWLQTELQKKSDYYESVFNP